MVSTKNVEPIERSKQLVKQHYMYKKPVNGQFEDCTKEVLRGVETGNSSDEEDQTITTELFKMIVVNVCKGNKFDIM